MSAYHQKVQKGSHCIFHNINVFFQTLMDFFFSSVTFATVRTNLRTNVFCFFPLSNSLH